MLIKFATKKNVYGNRKYIAIDTESKTYSKQPSTWLCIGDFCEVTTKALREMEEKAKSEGYNYIDAL